MTTRVLVPSGVLGLGFDADALARGVAARPDVIAIDGGSTDSGPAYLGAGTSKYADSTIRAEWRALLAARREAGVPLVIGSAGTCGTDSQVDRMVALTDELAREAGETLRVATVRSEQRVDALLKACDAGRVRPLAGGALDADDEPLRSRVERCTHVVALAGAEPIAAALATGADVVVAGRCTDTALISALPLARGERAGAAWHAAKIAECGALCSTRPTTGTVMVEIDAGGFTVRAFGRGARCTPYTVSAHMLYENSDPFVLHEPGGRLDVTDAAYADAGDGAVRVTGSVWVPDEAYTLKLEGARVAGHQVTSLVLVRDPRYVRRIDEWCETLAARLDGLARAQAGGGDHRIELRRIGVDATLGTLEPARGAPVEVGVLLLVTAATPELALDVARLANPHLLHHPLPGDESLPSFAFPYSPAETVRGPVHEFCLDHVLRVDSPTDGTRLDTLVVGAGA